MAPTIRDVAKLANVAPSTVSAVINDKGYIHVDTRAKVNSAIDKLNYTPLRSARGLANHKSGNLGFIVADSHFTKAEPFYTRVFLGSEFAARENHLYVLLTSVKADSNGKKDIPRFLLEQNVDGVMIAGKVSNYIIKDVIKRNIPTVLIDYGSDSYDCSKVLIDNIHGSMSATEYMINLGHEHIAFAGGDKGHPSAEERLTGYKIAMSNSDLPLRDECIEISNQEMSTEIGRRVFGRLIARDPKITAVVCSNDAVAIGVMLEARAKGLKVPKDISVVGFDDIATCPLTDPPLTTVRVDKEGLGATSVRVLVDQMNGNDMPTETRIGTRLIIRKSAVEPTKDNRRTSLINPLSSEGNSGKGGFVEMQKPEVFGRKLFLEPSENHFEKRAVLNPSIIEEDGKYHMLYRAVDPTMVSYVGHLTMTYDGDEPVIEKRDDVPLISPEQPFEKMGSEDPRIVKFEDEYHLFYTGWDEYNARLVHCSGKDINNLKNRKLCGPLFTNEEAKKLLKNVPELDRYRERWSKDPGDQALWEKDATILPRRVNGKIVFIHRLRPDMQIAYLDSIEQLWDQSFWEDYLKNMEKHILMERVSWWDESHMGMGPVPIETPEGWLVIYHGVTQKPVQTYRAGAALFDLDDPQKLIGRTDEPLFEPLNEWEMVGDVNNVVFPEGLVVRDNRLDMFYGGADKVIGVISTRMDQLIDFLKNK